MRPTKTETDLEFWNNAIQHWSNMEEKYFLMDDRAGEARCQERRFRAELALQEAHGLIVVYSGRAAPEWA